VLDTNIIGPSVMAFLQIQGDADHVVPYGYARALGGLAPFKLAGLGGSRPRYTSQHLNVTAYIFKNAGHTPWDNNKEAFHVMMQQMLDFLQKEMR
jgi:pimeloyl-ACP methyl ester carboxylesterase